MQMAMEPRVMRLTAAVMRSARTTPMQATAALVTQGTRDQDALTRQQRVSAKKNAMMQMVTALKATKWTAEVQEESAQTWTMATRAPATRVMDYGVTQSVCNCVTP